MVSAVSAASVNSVASQAPKAPQAGNPFDANIWNTNFQNKIQAQQPKIDGIKDDLGRLPDKVEVAVDDKTANTFNAIA